VTIQAVYDRSDLIHRAIATLKTTLIEESIIVALVCVVFLMHVRSALVAILMLPVGVLIAFIAMRMLGMNSNIMSLGGIAIAIGAMVDAAIVMIENAHKHLERLLKPVHTVKERADAMIAACKEVGPALFFSLLIITVSFLPVFTLESQEGRLFSPLAYTKTFAMAGAALLSVTLVPVLMLLFIRGKIMPEAKNPVNRFLIWLYRPIIEGVMRWKKLTIVLALIAMGCHLYPASSWAASSCRRSTRARCCTCRPRCRACPSPRPPRCCRRRTRSSRASPRWLGLRQGRPRQHRDRPGADRDVRDRHQPQAAVRVAAGHDHRQADRRDGQGAAVPRRLQRLDHADQGAHRHAVHRHPHADRHQGLRQGPGRDGEAGARRSRPWSRPCRARPAPSPSG
jgi:hypothetical protein